MKVMSRRVSVLIVGELMGDMTPDLLRETVLGTSECASNGVLIPGLPVVESAHVRITGNPENEVTLSVTFVGYEVVPAGDYKGDEVTEEFVTSYIMGAEAYWCGHGDEFFPTSASAVVTL